MVVVMVPVDVGVNRVNTFVFADATTEPIDAGTAGFFVVFVFATAVVRIGRFGRLKGGRFQVGLGVLLVKFFDIFCRQACRFDWGTLVSLFRDRVDWFVVGGCGTGQSRGTSAVRFREQIQVRISRQAFTGWWNDRVLWIS